MNNISDPENKKEKKFIKKMKDRPWFNLTIALCIAVILFFLLQNYHSIWSGIKIVWNFVSPVVVAMVLAYIIDPLVRVFENHIFKKMKSRKHARYVSIVIGIVIILLALGAILWVLLPQIVSSIQMLVSNLSGYMTNFENMLAGIGDGMFSKIIDEIGFSDLSEKLVKWLTDLISNGGVIRKSLSIGSSLVNGVVTVILAVYYLFDKERLIRLGKRFFRFVLKEKRYKPFHEFCSKCNYILVRYICCNLLETVIVGVANAIVMVIFDMPYVVIISVVVGVTNLLPTFGPIIGGVIGGFILILVDPIDALIFIIATVIIQFLDGYVLKPRLYSGSLGVSSILILISIIVLGRIFGVIGMLCAIPFAAMVEYTYRLLRQKKAEKAIIEK